MNQEEVVIDFLNSSKQKIVDFTQKHQSNESLSDLLETNREILKCIEDLCNFLNPCLNTNFQTSYKKYEDCVYINRNKNDENEISLILERIQNETNDVLDFLENLQLTYNSLFYCYNNPNNCNNNNKDNSNNNKDKEKDKLLGIYKRNNLLTEKMNRVRRVIEENDIKIKELNKDKLSCKKELEKCLETLNNFKMTNSEIHTIENRINLYSNLSHYLYL